MNNNNNNNNNSYNNNARRQRRRGIGGVGVGKRNQQHQQQQQKKTMPAALVVANESVLLAETNSGIEVTFSSDSTNNPNRSDEEPTRGLEETTPTMTGQSSLAKAVAIVAAAGRDKSVVLTLDEQLAERQKIYRAQFTITACSGRENRPDAGNTTKDSNNNIMPALPEYHPRKHRISLFGHDVKQSQMLFDDVLFLLRSHEVVDEVTCVRDELAQLDAEIESMEEDRRVLEKRSLYFAEEDHDKNSGGWDLSYQIARTNSATQRELLQEQRGLCLTLSLENKKALDQFLTKCGSNKSISASSPIAVSNMRSFLPKRMVPDKNAGMAAAQQGARTIVTIRPENCGKNGAGTTIRHICLSRAMSAESSFLLSRDAGKTQYWGRLPDRLYRRVRGSGLDFQKCISDIMYLACGPLGSYYVEFRSGECWWATPVDNDEEFHLICKEWDVHRVVFGSCTYLNDGLGRNHLIMAWIILGRDGRVAWKNLPSRLHKKLESRMANQPAPIEVALGYGESYFVRYFDGTTDYSLPARIADVVKDLSAVTSISLHPEMPHDFIIRHRG